MTEALELADIQGNIVRAYGKYNYPFARYFFLHIDYAAAGRRFVEEVRKRITTAERWDKNIAVGEMGGPPKITLNIALSYYGIRALKLPTQTWQSMPHEFINGMKARAFILGDSNIELPEKEMAESIADSAHDKKKAEPKAPEEENKWLEKWDPIWRDNVGWSDKAVHIWISMNARARAPGSDQPVDELERQTEWLRTLCKDVGGVRILTTNGIKGDEEYQAANAVFTEIEGGAKFPSPNEHFGFADGIGDPVFKGQLPAEEEARRVKGRGKWMNAETGWEPLATGEFILGYPDEAQEPPPASPPDNFTRNGSFMVYRKLHQNVASFAKYYRDEAEKYAAIANITVEQAEVYLKAKSVGRWPDGVPLSKAPTYDEWQACRAQKGLDDPNPIEALRNMADYRASPDIVDFKYGDDIKGYKCPVGAHLRRTNTRDYLDPLNQPDSDNVDATTQLNKRRRILRRGLPYGSSDGAKATDNTEQGIAFMVICSSIFRQFEFVQQQWIQYGLDFNQGNNTCPVLGNHSIHKRHTIPADPDGEDKPYICDNLPQFVETRGGEYFFIPSMTALRMIAMGTVDPT